MIRLAPSVHGKGDTGLVSQLIGVARKRGHSGYQNRRPAGSVSAGEAARQFSYFGDFAATDNPTSSNRTRDQLGWEPTGPELLADLNGPGYFATR
jgi:hypothetical protein